MFDLGAYEFKNLNAVGITPKQDAFDKIKRIMACDTLLTYLDFNETFKIHTNSSTIQLGVFIIQKCKPIAFYSIKPTYAQKRCTVIDKELLSIIKTLNQFRTIFLVQRLRIYTDHKNITCKNFNTDILLI